MTTLKREVEIVVDASPEDVWRAITDPKLTRQYYYGTDILSDWSAGSRWTSESGDELYLDGEILEIDPPRRLVQTFHVAIEEPAASDSPSTVTWELEPNGKGTLLRLTHVGLQPATYEYTENGWEHILGGMKTLLETGQPVTAGGMD